MPTARVAGRSEPGFLSTPPDEPGGDDRPRSRTTIDLTVATPIRFDREGVVSAAERAAAELGLRGEVRVRAVGDDEMARAHDAHCGVAGTTDVITTDLREPVGAAATDGMIDADLLVCVDEAGRQARERGIVLEHELVLYIVHGILHCLGMDDHDEAGYAAMHAREDLVLTAIGIGAVFSRRGEGGGAAS